MTKVKFTWQFKISDDNEFLEIYLNDGLNVMIEINHPSFHLHLSQKLSEILWHEHDCGTKTVVFGLDAIQKAESIKKS